MVFTESARVIGPMELREMMDEESGNPAVEREVFIETRAKEGNPSKVFPVFLEAYAYEYEDEAEKMKLNPKMVFKGCLMYVEGGEFHAVRIMLHSWEFNLTKRVWDKPPTKGLRDDEIWLEDAEVQ